MPSGPNTGRGALHGSPNGFLERAFEAGADDLVSLPQSSGQLGFALEKALARSRGAVASSSEGAMITVLGPKGGTGKTVTSSNLTVALALEGKSSVLVDLDLQFGDVGLALWLAPTKTIYDLATSGGTLDADKVDSFLARRKHPNARQDGSGTWSSGRRAVSPGAAGEARPKP